MRRALLVASCLGLLACPSARAADAVPEPTAVVTVSAAGQALPKVAMTAKWIVAGKGQQAQLNIDGYSVPGTKTTVDALWTSRDFRTYDNIASLELGLEGTHTGATTAGLPAGLSFGLRVRQAGRAWGPWADVEFPYPANAGAAAMGGADPMKISLGSSGKTLRQVQFRMHLELMDASQENEVWKLLANV